MTDQNQAAVDEHDEFKLDSNGYITLAIWVCVDSDGNYDMGKDDDDALSNFDNNEGGDAARRLVQVKVRLRVPRPVVTSVQVPNEAGETDIETKA